MKNEDIKMLQNDIRIMLSSVYNFLSKYHEELDYGCIEEMIYLISKANEVDRISEDWRNYE